MFWVRKDEKYQNIKKLNFLDRQETELNLKIISKTLQVIRRQGQWK